MSASKVTKASWSVLTASRALALDQKLMGDELSFTLEQLVEMAGFGVAQAIAKQYPRAVARSRVSVLVGPGNNGLDGLVAARWLKTFGYADCAVCMPVASKRALASALVRQNAAAGVRTLDDAALRARLREATSDDIVVDALFGFSFQGTIREPFAGLMGAVQAARASLKALVAVDVPSGLAVDATTLDAGERASMPDMLVSLTAPKPCSTLVYGHHWLGGRFVPQLLLDEYELFAPPYPGTDQVVKLA